MSSEENNIMSPEEFYEAMKEWKDGGEEGHWEMDKIMCSLLKNLGYDKGVEVFKMAPSIYYS